MTRSQLSKKPRVCVQSPVGLACGHAREYISYRHASRIFARTGYGLCFHRWEHSGHVILDCVSFGSRIPATTFAWQLGHSISISSRSSKGTTGSRSSRDSFPWGMNLILEQYRLQHSVTQTLANRAPNVVVLSLFPFTAQLDFAGSPTSWANATPFATWADYLGLKFAE